jgi:4-carboxymuconolactone decarboxylase
MRLSPIPPDQLTPDLRALHEAIVGRMASSLSLFKSQAENGALIGPFPPLLHFPRFGKPAFQFLDSLISEARLPGRVREIAILVVGSSYEARYELYSHEKMAHAAGLEPAQIASIAAGQRPSDLTEIEGAAYDYAAALMTPGPVPAATYDRATTALGSDGVGELTFLVGGYALISVLLNGFDVPAPGAD